MARASAVKALELDNKLGEAHSALGEILSACEWDWARAEQELKRGIELTPNNVLGHVSYQYYLAAMGRFDEAFLEASKVIDIDPLSPMHHRYPGWLSYFARRYDESIRELQKLPELRDTSGSHMWRAWPLGMLARAYTSAGRYEEALDACAKLRGILPIGEFVWWDAVIAYVYAVTGRRPKALEILDYWRNKTDRDPYALAVMYTGLGDTDAAFEWMKASVEERSAWIWLLKIDPLLDPLRSDPRFQDLLRRMNFPE
jgi:tetratricopeptide (TPR) repeat protein